MALATGYVLMFFSEFYFLNEGPGAEFVEKWTTNPLSMARWLGEFSLYYAGWGYIMLAAIGLFRVRSLWSLFIAGALFGWAVEGIVIPLIYGNMPHTLGWPSLGWHAVVDVGLGWYLIRKILQKNNYRYTIILAVALGLFWGVWCTWYWGEHPPEQAAEYTTITQELPEAAPPATEEAGSDEMNEAEEEEEYYPPFPARVYPAYALVLGVLLILAYIVMDKFGGNEFQPTMGEVVALTAWHTYSFCFGAFKMAETAIYVLPALFAGGFLVLWWNRRTETHPDILSMLAGRVAWGHYALLLLIPICAIPVYTALYRWDVHLPLIPLVARPLMIAGNAMLLLSVIMTAVRKRPEGPDSTREAEKPAEDNAGAV
jgi:hypothetical protein